MTKLCEEKETQIMKNPRFSIILMALTVTLLPHMSWANGGNDTAVVSVSISAPPLRVGEKSEGSMCYQLAEAGEVLAIEEETPDKWFSELAKHTIRWKVSRLQSGLVCKVKISEVNNPQFGSGVKNVGCSCEGPLEIVR